MICSFLHRRLKGKAGEHLLTVRVYDRYENVGVAKTVFVSASKVRGTLGCDLNFLLRRAI